MFVSLQAKLNCTPAVLEAMVAYCYGQLRDIPSDLVVELFKAANMYQVCKCHGVFIEPCWQMEST